MAETQNSRRTGSGRFTRTGPVVVPHTTTWEVEHETNAQTLDEFATSTGYTWQTFFADAGRYARTCYFADVTPPSGATQRWAFELMRDGFDDSTHRRPVRNLGDRWNVSVEGSILGRY